MQLFIVYAIAVAIGYLLRKKFPIFQKPAVYILLPATLFAPVAFFGVLFGLAGSDSVNFLIMGFGYILVLVFSLASLKYPKLLLMSFVGIAIAAIGAYRNNEFWSKENINLCAKLRADTYCVESSIGFSCSQKSSLGGFSTGNICSERLSDTKLDQINEQKRQVQVQSSIAQGTKPEKKLPNLGYVGRATGIYEKIVKQIIASPNPANLNFENQLKAIYNCINSEHDDLLKAEAYGNMYLGSIAKTTEQISRYRMYTSSKGRITAENMLIAALPAGEKEFNCAYLKQFSD